MRPIHLTVPNSAKAACTQATRSPSDRMGASGSSYCGSLSGEQGSKGDVATKARRTRGGESNRAEQNGTGGKEANGRKQRVSEMGLANATVGTVVSVYLPNLSVCLRV